LTLRRSQHKCTGAVEKKVVCEGGGGETLHKAYYGEKKGFQKRGKPSGMGQPESSALTQANGGDTNVKR